MPLYEYLCSDCGNVIEVIQKFSDVPLKICPDCSGKLHKIISQSSFHLKGSGWYVTDYNKSSDKPKENVKKEKREKTSLAVKPKAEKQKEAVL